MVENTQEIKGRSFIKTLSIVLISLISVILIILGIIYFTNEQFKENSNEIFSTLPGGIGGYFQSIPTKDEKEQLKKDIANYYIGLEEDRIMDKLLIVKGEDEELYNDLIILMNNQNSNKMKKIKEDLRMSQFKNDPIHRIFLEMDKENEEKINEFQKYYISLKYPQAIKEIERTHANNQVTMEELTGIFEKLKPDQAAKFLYYLDPELKRQIKFKLKPGSLQNIEKDIQGIEEKENNLKQIAMQYEYKSLEESIEDLGNLEKYNINELAFIFKNLSLVKSSEILSGVNDNDFMSTLLGEINEIEELKKEGYNTSSNITKGISIFKTYNLKIDELAKAYQKMPIKELNEIIVTMLNRNEIYQKYPISEREEITFTEEQLVIDALNKLKTNMVADLLKDMKEKDAIKLSKKLVNANN